MTYPSSWAEHDVGILHEPPPKPSVATDGFHDRPTIPGLTMAVDLMAEPEPDVDSLADGILPVPGVAVLAGDPKSFKTMLALQLAITVAHHSIPTFLGRPVRHGPVLFVLEEGSRHRLRERMRMMLAGFATDGDVSAYNPPADLAFALFQGTRLDNERSLNLLRQKVQAVQPVLTVLDPLAFIHGKDENRPSEMAPIMRTLVRIAQESSGLVLVVHHLNKPNAERRTRRLADRMRGAGSIAAGTDANLILEREGDLTARLRGEYRDLDGLDLYLRLDPESLLLCLTEAPEPVRKVPRAELLAWVKERGRVGVRDTAERFGVTRNPARDALEAAVAAGHLDSAMDGAKAMYFEKG